MRVALYERRSRAELQPDSLEVQDEVLRAYAARHRHEVVAVFRDSASGRSTEKRDEFKRMIEEVKAGPKFEAILVRDVSRWSRGSIDESAFYEWMCRAQGVDVLYVEEQFGADTSAYSQLLKNLKRFAAAEYLRERAHLVQAASARLVREGFWPTGSVPYGMKRLRVSESGEVLGEMRRGDRKALSNERIKLAPGDEADVAVVRRIFERFASGRTLEQIEHELNGDGVPSSTGKKWTPAMLGYLLSNEAYVGSLVYIIRGGEKSSIRKSLSPHDERVIRCEGAHPALIDRATWQAAQAQLRGRTHRRNDDDRARDLRTARERWGQPAEADATPASALRGGYGADDDVVVRYAFTEAVAGLRRHLQSQFHVVDFEDGILVDHLLFLGFVASLPHARFGAMHWQFALPEGGTEDLIVGLGFSPPDPIAHVATFAFHRRGRKSATCRPLVSGTNSPQHIRIDSPERLVEVIRRSIRFRGVRAEERFLCAVRGKERLNLNDLATELGWPAKKARTMYRKLELRGESVPPVGNSRVGKRVTVICPHCLRSRSLAPATVLTLKTDVCFECLHRPPIITPSTHVAECPDCGARRLLQRSDVDGSPDGVNRLCLKCSRLKNVSKRSGT